MNTLHKGLHKFLVLSVSVIALSACAINPQQTGSRSSVMDYLYPDAEQQTVEERIPHLSLPLRVGVAFVPDTRAYGSTGYRFMGGDPLENLSEHRKMALLEQVASNFRELKYVNKVEVIPSAYLRAGGSFTNLRLIQSMYGVDMMALVSHDQVQFTEQDALAISYWTIVGAYFVNGEKNDTNTLLDTVVYDISSEQLLFRAPGSSHVKGRSTPINLSEELRKDSQEGFQLAADQMIENLKVELTQFEKKVKAEPKTIKITSRSGGGSSSLLLCLALLACVLARRNLLTSDVKLIEQ